MYIGRDGNQQSASGGTASIGQIQKPLDAGTKSGQKNSAPAQEKSSALVQNEPEDTEAAREAQEIRKVRVPRTRRYLQELERIDQLSEHDAKMIEAVKMLPANNRLVGILAKCKLKGCIIHAIDRLGVILEHYRKEEEIPAELKPGYSVYEEYPDCVSVEVYTQWFCVTRADGSVKFINREET